MPSGNWNGQNFTKDETERRQAAGYQKWLDTSKKDKSGISDAKSIFGSGEPRGVLNPKDFK